MLIVDVITMNNCGSVGCISHLYVNSVSVLFSVGILTQWIEAERKNDERIQDLQIRLTVKSPFFVIVLAFLFFIFIVPFENCLLFRLRFEIKCLVCNSQKYNITRLSRMLSNHFPHDRAFLSFFSCYFWLFSFLYSITLIRWDALWISESKWEEHAALKLLSSL